MKKPGVYEVIPSGCYEFAQQVYLYDTNNPTELEFTPIKWKVRGRISGQVVMKRKPEFELSVTTSTGRTLKILKIEQKEKNDREAVYEYEFFSNEGEQVTITPSSADLLFYPQSVTFKTQQGPLIGCHSPVSSIEGRRQKSVDGI